MVIGLLVVSAIPTTIGVCEALSAQKKANAAAKEKAKFHLTATVSLDDDGPVECWCVLKDGKLWIDHPSAPIEGGYKFTGWYFAYPCEAEEKPLGMVSFVSDNPPALNWIFVDKDTGLVRHGSRADTLGQVVGSWFWTTDERWLTLKGDALQFIAVEVEEGKWAVAWDPDGKIRDMCDAYDSEEEEDEEDEAEDGEDGGGAVDGGEQKPPKPAKFRPRDWVPVMLQRRMQLGMESRYVKPGQAQQGGGQS